MTNLKGLWPPVVIRDANCPGIVKHSCNETVTLTIQGVAVDQYQTRNVLCGWYPSIGTLCSRRL